MSDTIYEDAHGNQATLFAGPARSGKRGPRKLQITDSEGRFVQLDARDLIVLVDAVKRHLGVT